MQASLALSRASVPVFSHGGIMLRRTERKFTTASLKTFLRDAKNSFQGFGPPADSNIKASTALEDLVP